MAARVFRPIAYLGLAVVSFAITAGSIRSLTPDHYKVSWFMEQKDEVDLVFLGSSHVLRQFDPSQFDAGRDGVAENTHSLNMGLQWMGLPEELYLLSKLLKASPAKLQWVVIEARPFESGMPGAEVNDFTARRIDWHRTDITVALLRELWRQDLESEEKWSLMHRHVEHWWRRTTNLGQGLAAFRGLGGGVQISDEERAELGPAGDGFFPLNETMDGKFILERRRRFLERPGRLQKVAGNLQQSGDGGPASQGQLDFVRQMESHAAQHNVALIWWLHPGMERLAGWRQLLANGEIEHLLTYDAPQLYPDLYRRDLHFDFTHLNRRGAFIMTEFFVQDFKSLVTEAPALTR